MTKEKITVRVATQDTVQEWMITNRPFEKKRDAFLLEDIKDIEEQYGGWDHAKYALGFQEEEINRWKKEQCAILEIGPGQGTGFAQLADRGIAIYALEPSLKYPTASMAMVTLQQEKFQERISAANAVDASYAFSGKQFDVAFAIGLNFQTYAPTEQALISQIGGVIHALKQTDDSFFSFQIAPDGSCDFNLQGDAIKNFNLIAFLDDNAIRYTTNTFVDELGDPNAKAIRIFRQNNTSESSEAIQDNATRFDTTLSQNISKYVKQP